QQPLNAEVERHKVTVRLAREQLVRGRLLDLQGEPATGVKLFVTHVGKRATGAFFPAQLEGLATWPSPVTTDATGRFLLHGWPRGAVRHAVELRVPRGVLLRGKVVEAGSGRPVAGAGVQLWPRADNPFMRPEVLAGYRQTVLSGTDGTFRMAVPPGPGHLLV